MKTLIFLLEKEFRQVFRDPAILRMLFIMPVIQLIVLPLAANYEVKNINIDIIDHDKSDFSSELINRLNGSGYFKLKNTPGTFEEAMKDFANDNADIILEIPANFEKDLVKENNSKLFMAVNAINGAKANIGASYLNSLIQKYNIEVRTEWQNDPDQKLQKGILLEYSNWYNIHMNYRNFMVPGILAILLTMVGMFLTSLNIVREKEAGTIEQINVTPIKKHIFILGKLLPFWIMGLVVLTLGLLVARIIYGISPLGNLFHVYLFAAVFLWATLGLGLLISTISKTQQQAMLIAFFLLMIFILLGGLYTSIDSMPKWAQIITWFNPVKYFIEVMRMIILKGSTFYDIIKHVGIMILFAIFFNAWAVLSYSKRS
ncbi:MAG: ABC transporter permease [Bacteroidia bacterium]